MLSCRKISSWTPIIRTRWIQIPVISDSKPSPLDLLFSHLLSAIRTSFRFSWEFEKAGFNCVRKTNKQEAGESAQPEPGPKLSSASFSGYPNSLLVLIYIHFPR